MKMQLAPLALTLALGAPGAMAAADIYRSVMPDGSVRYGEGPAPGAKATKRIPPPPASTGTITATREEQERVRNSSAGSPPSATVLTPPERTSPQPAEQGRIQSPQGLPKRAY
jgi:hypothetical protein